MIYVCEVTCFAAGQYYQNGTAYDFSEDDVKRIAHVMKRFRCSEHPNAIPEPKPEAKPEAKPGPRPEFRAHKK